MYANLKFTLFSAVLAADWSPYQCYQDMTSFFVQNFLGLWECRLGNNITNFIDDNHCGRYFLGKLCFSMWMASRGFWCSVIIAHCSATLTALELIAQVLKPDQPVGGATYICLSPNDTLWAHLIIKVTSKSICWPGEKTVVKQTWFTFSSQGMK